MIPAAVQPAAQAVPDPTAQQGINPLLALLPKSAADVPGMPLPGTERAASPFLETEGLVEQEPHEEADVSALGVLPKVFTHEGAPDADRLSKLATRISQAIEAGEAQRGRLPERWEKNEAFARNKHLAPTRVPYPGAYFFHMPFVGPRLAQRKATFVQTVIGPRPHFRFRQLGSVKPANVVEDLIQFAMDVGDFERFANRYAENLMLANAGLARTSFQMHEDGMAAVGATVTGEFALPVVESIDPDGFVIFPANENGINGARFVGHTFDQMQSEVVARQKSGDWLEADIVAGDMTRKERKEARSSRDVGDLQDGSSHATQVEDENVTVYAGVWKFDEDDDGKEELYRVILIRNPDVVLRIEPLEGAFKGYHAGRVKHEDGTFWTESSPAQDLQGLQIVLNTLVNQSFWSAEYASRPAVMMEGGDVKGAKGYKPGEFQMVRSLKGAAPIPSDYDGNWFMPLIEMVKEFGDSASRTSDTITGAPSSPGSATATEQSIKLQGYQTGVSDDISEATPGLVSIAADFLRLLRLHWDDWYPVYKDFVAVKDPSELDGKFTIELAGRSPADSPQAVAEQAQALIGMFAQLKDVLPNLPALVLEALKTFIESLNLPNKHDFVDAIDQAIQQQAQIEQQAAAQAQATGQVPGQAAPQAGQPGAMPTDPQQLLLLLAEAIAQQNGTNTTTGGQQPGAAGAGAGDPALGVLGQPGVAGGGAVGAP